MLLEVEFFCIKTNLIGSIVAGIMKRLSSCHIRRVIGLIMSLGLFCEPVLAQDASQANDSNAIVDGDFNNIIQTPNQNQNLNEISFARQPLDNPIYTPPNIENDFGFNMSLGLNTLDADNFTIYVGAIYHPGRSKAHRLRMKKIIQETELLEVQKNIAQAELALLQQQIQQIESKLKNY